MSLRKNQSGFSLVELLLVLAAVGAIAFVGYTVYSRNQNGDQAAQSASAGDVPAAPEVKSAEDLDKASSTLDEVNLDDSNDSSQLDSQLSGF